MRTPGSPEFLEYRRRLAVRMLEAGLEPDEVAEVLQVSIRSVQRWETLGQAGDAWLDAVPHPGAPPRLTEAQARRVLEWLDQSPTALGFPTDRWTAPRVAQLLEREFDVRMNVRYLNDWLARHGITPQIPARLSKEHSQRIIQGWLGHQWPRVKKGGGPARHPRIHR